MRNPELLLKLSWSAGRGVSCRADLQAGLGSCPELAFVVCLFVAWCLQGAATVRKLLPGVVSVFLVAESEAQLVTRLVSRKTEPLDKMLTRVQTARWGELCIRGCALCVQQG